MKIGFATDIHLDFLKEVHGLAKHKRAGAKLAKDLDVLLIGGDISNGQQFPHQFSAFCEGAAGTRVFFVLGNHDFWNADEFIVRNNAAQFPGYLDRWRVARLTPSVGLCGRSGWYDTLSGNPFESRITMNDWQRIPRLADCWQIKQLLWKHCRAWAEEETEKASAMLREAASQYPEVYFVTHFPLFTEACFDEHGNPDIEENGMWPWSINTTMGYALREIADEYPGVNFTVFTGHTHGGGEKKISHNIACVAGKARYGNPSVARVWEI